MRNELKHIYIMIPSLLLAAIILGVSLPGKRELLLSAQGGILNETKQHLTNTILYTCLRNYHKALGDWEKMIEKDDAELLNESKIHTYKNLNPIYKGTKEGAYCSVVLTAKFMLQKW